MIVGSDSLVTHVKEVKSSVYHSGKHQLLHCIHIQALLQKKDVCGGFLRKEEEVIWMLLLGEKLLKAEYY